MAAAELPTGSMAPGRTPDDRWPYHYLDRAFTLTRLSAPRNPIEARFHFQGTVEHSTYNLAV